MEIIDVGKRLLDSIHITNMLLSILKKASRPSIAYVLQCIVPSTKAGYNKLLEFYGRTKYAKNNHTEILQTRKANTPKRP